MWGGLLSVFPNYKKVKVDGFSAKSQELIDLVLKFPIKKNIQDYLHILTAKHNKLWFITGDNMDGWLQKIKKNYYAKIITLKEFHKNSL